MFHERYFSGNCGGASLSIHQLNPNTVEAVWKAADPTAVQAVSAAVRLIEATRAVRSLSLFAHWLVQ